MTGWEGGGLALCLWLFLLLPLRGLLLLVLLSLLLIKKLCRLSKDHVSQKPCGDEKGQYLVRFKVPDSVCLSISQYY